jgi:hypothetical protein
MLAGRADIIIADVKPECPVISQHPSRFAEYAHQRINVPLSSVFQADLFICPVIALSVNGQMNRSST